MLLRISLIPLSWKLLDHVLRTNIVKDIQVRDIMVEMNILIKLKIFAGIELLNFMDSIQQNGGQMFKLTLDLQQI